MNIKLNDLLQLDDLEDYMIRSNYPTRGLDPLNFFIYDKDRFFDYCNWQRFKGGKLEYNLSRKYAIQFVKMPQYKKWLFVGVYELIGEEDSLSGEGIVYSTLEVDKYKMFTGRLVCYFDKPKNYSRQSYYRAEALGKDSDKPMIDYFTVDTILDKQYEGIEFQGYENVNLSFSDLQSIVESQTTSWMTALSAVKGIYVITDRSNGKLYVGKADGENKIWQRWSSYANSFHANNKDLTHLYDTKGADHFKKHMSISILEIFKPTTSDSMINTRESFWKEVLDTRKHGYNRN